LYYTAWYYITMAASMASHRFQVLLALASGPMHGSGIARAVLGQSGGAMRLWPVKLYSTIDQLATDGLIREATSRDRPPGQSERRRYYVLTPHGRAALKAEADRLADLAHTAKAILARHRG
jgi:DNA-binding PadR family transcriptional regulator